jgi:YVTN family beta-propeller protein
MALGAAALMAAACGFVEPALQPLSPEPLTRVLDPPVDRRTAAFDVMALDQGQHRLYVADALDAGVDVFDVSRAPGRYLTTIHLGKAPNGLVFAADVQRLFTGNNDSTVSVLDTTAGSAHPYDLVATIDTKGAGAADLIDYDAKDNRIYVTNPDDGLLSAIDVKTGSVIGQIRGLGLIQQPRYNPADSMVYVPGSDRNSIFRIDPASEQVVGEYALPVVCVPHGLAIDPKTNQGLIGCGDKDNQIAIAWDFATMRVIRTFDLAGAGDAVIFDEQAQHFYFAAQNFSPPEVAVFSTAPIMFLTAVPTSHRSSTVAYDATNKHIYTTDGRHLEAALWTFPDPVAGCSGAEAVQAANGVSRAQVPHCFARATTGGGASG